MFGGGGLQNYINGLIEDARAAAVEVAASEPTPPTPAPSQPVAAPPVVRVSVSAELKQRSRYAQKLAVAAYTAPAGQELAYEIHRLTEASWMGEGLKLSALCDAVERDAGRLGVKLKEDPPVGEAA